MSLPLLVLLVLVPAMVRAQDPAELQVQVAQAAEAFVDAFNDLDWDRFAEAWAEDATAFMPMPEFPRRLNGRDTIVATFRSVFADFPDRLEGPPYLTIDPVDLRIDVIGTSAIVTFHLGDEAPRNRRTLIFVRQGGAWRIAHLHASRPPGGGAIHTVIGARARQLPRRVHIVVGPRDVRACPDDGTRL
jgi:ketosteroid isomerase-like protein